MHVQTEVSAAVLLSGGAFLLLACTSTSKDVFATPRRCEPRQMPEGWDSDEDEEHLEELARDERYEAPVENTAGEGR